MTETPGVPMRFVVSRVDSVGLVEGTLVSGTIHNGDRVITAPGRQCSSVTGLHQAGQMTQCAGSAARLTIMLKSAVRLQHGDVITHADSTVLHSDQFEARLHWLASEEMLPGRRYFLRAMTGSVYSTISRLKYRLDGGLQIAARTLHNSEQGVVNIALNAPLVFDPVATCDQLGRFQLLDRPDGKLLARGEIRHGLRRAGNLQWQALAVDKQSRAALKNQTPKVIWMTGLSGSGKSTIANRLEKKLLQQSLHTYVLDGDNIRQGLNRDLGFTAADRVENIRRVAETARLMLDAGLIVITSFISPFRAEREMARQLFDRDEFVEVFVDTALEVCEARDTKGLYRKARAGEIRNFTGIDCLYEPPERPEIVLETVRLNPSQSADLIMDYLRRK